MARDDRRTGDGRYQTKLTPELADAIVEGVESGLFDQQNATRHGVDVTTLKSWVERGLDEEAEEPFRSFAERYIKASIALEEHLLGIVLEAAEPFESRRETIEEEALARGFAEADAADGERLSLGDMPAGTVLKRSRSTTREQKRGDWKAAGWILERRWPLRWSSSRQPDGGPKEMLRMPDGSVNRRRKTDAMTAAPPPELIAAFRAKGHAIVPLETLARLEAAAASVGAATSAEPPTKGRP
jgi:hypothetical protein